MKNILLIIFLFAFVICSADPKNIRVLTYNLRYDNSADGINSWDNRKSKLVEQLKNFDCDIIGIQEGLLQQIDYLKEVLPDYSFYGVGRDDGKTNGEFAGIFYKKNRFELLKSGTFWLSPTPTIPSKGWDAALNRICSYVNLKDKNTDKNLFVFNTHFDHIGSKAREESAKLILKKIKEINKLNECTIVCGDFNSSSSDASILTIKKVLDDSGEKAISKLGNQKSSFNGFGSKEAVQQQIDFIFYNSKLIASVFLIDDEKINDNQFYSDHFPVFCEFIYR